LSKIKTQDEDILLHIAIIYKSKKGSISYFTQDKLECKKICPIIFYNLFGPIAHFHVDHACLLKYVVVKFLIVQWRAGSLD